MAKSLFENVFRSQQQQILDSRNQPRQLDVADHYFLSLIQLQRNQGKGAAVRAGLYLFIFIGR